MSSEFKKELLVMEALPKASRETRATSPGINLKTFFPIEDLMIAPEKKPAVITIPDRTPLATFSVARDIFRTLETQHRNVLHL
jgi:hypothetical protein